MERLGREGKGRRLSLRGRGDNWETPRSSGGFRVLCGKCHFLGHSSSQCPKTAGLYNAGITEVRQGDLAFTAAEKPSQPDRTVHLLDSDVRELGQGGLALLAAEQPLIPVIKAEFNEEALGEKQGHMQLDMCIAKNLASRLRSRLRPKSFFCRD